MAVPGPERVFLTNPQRGGFRFGDARDRTERTLVWRAATLPSRRILAQHTLAYHEVLRAPVPVLRRWFRGKVVLVGDLRTAATSARPDRARIDDGSGGGTEEFNTYVHGASLSSLIEGSRLHPAGLPLWVALLLGAASAGCAFGHRVASRHPLFRVGVGAAGVAAIPLAGLALAVGISVIVQPTALVLAFLLGLGSGAAIRYNMVRSRPWLVPARDSTGSGSLGSVGPSPI